MATPASSTAAQPTTYVTFRNPSVLQHLAGTAWSTVDHSRQQETLTVEWNHVFRCDCLANQRLLGLLRAADMPTPLIWTKLTAVFRQLSQLIQPPRKRSFAAAHTCAALYDVFVFPFHSYTALACSAHHKQTPCTQGIIRLVLQD